MGRMGIGRTTVLEAAGRTTAVGDCRILAGRAAVTCVTVGMGPFRIGQKASSSGITSSPSRGEEKALLSSGGSSGRGSRHGNGAQLGSSKGQWATGNGIGGKFVMRVMAGARTSPSGNDRNASLSGSSSGPSGIGSSRKRRGATAEMCGGPGKASRHNSNSGGGEAGGRGR